MPRWTDVTPEAVDVCETKHRLSMADLGTPEMEVTNRLYSHSESIQAVLLTTARMIVTGADVKQTLGALMIHGIRLGWYLRDDADGMESLIGTIDEAEIEQLRRQIQREDSGA